MTFVLSKFTSVRFHPEISENLKLLSRLDLHENVIRDFKRELASVLHCAVTFSQQPSNLLLPCLEEQNQKLYLNQQSTNSWLFAFL